LREQPEASTPPPDDLLLQLGVPRATSKKAGTRTSAHAAARRLVRIE
jgi:hypothetical protein